MLKKLQAKPEHIKKSISLVLTTIIFMGITFVWISSWGARNQGDITREKTLSPLDSFAEVFHGVVTDVKDNIAGGPMYVENANNAIMPAIPSTSTSITSNFDTSGIVVIDATSSDTQSPATSTTLSTTTLH